MNHSKHCASPLKKPCENQKLKKPYQKPSLKRTITFKELYSAYLLMSLTVKPWKCTKDKTTNIPLLFFLFLVVRENSITKLQNIKYRILPPKIPGFI